MKEPKILWDFTGMEIEQRSFAIIEEECLELKNSMTADEWRVARRLIHTTADPKIALELEFKNDPFTAARSALKRKAPIYCDSNMIRSGISVPKLKRWNKDYSDEDLYCFIKDEDVIQRAQSNNRTRALEGIEKAKDLLHGGILLCGNAPLALAGCIRMVLNLEIKPAFIVGMPVGFVNVCESKEWLNAIDTPSIRINGRRGGSPLAVATLHAIMENEECLKQN